MQQVTAGQVFVSKEEDDPSITELIAKQPSFGHYIVEKLGGPLADTVLIVSL